MNFTEIDDVCWTEKFIELIRERPAIYNKSLPEHSNRIAIQKYWTEICEQIIVEWEKLKPKEKSEKGKNYLFSTFVIRFYHIAREVILPVM